MAVKTEVKVDTKWLQAELERVYGAGWNKKAARDMGVDQGHMSRLTHGSRKWTAEYLSRLQGIVKRPLEEVYKHVGVSRPPVAHTGQFRVVGQVDSDGRVRPGHQGVPVHVPAPANMIEGFALVVRAPSLPTDGWTLYYDPKPEDPARLVGRICVVRVVGSIEPVVGVLRRGMLPDCYSVTGFVGHDQQPIEREKHIVDAVQVLWLKTL